MSLAIYKYEIALINPRAATAQDFGLVSMPKGARVIHAQDQRGSIYLWAIVDLEEKTTENKRFLVVGTGQPFDKSDLIHMRHIATFLSGIFVWHVFEWV